MQETTISPITDVLSEAMQSSGVWTPGCPVSLTRLAVISSIKYVDFNNAEHSDGELVVLDVVAHQALKLFEQLYQHRFPIAKIQPMHHYKADDELSMADNNTSCFCHRPIEGSTLSSMHSYGLAIDINPLQNPFIVFGDGKEATPTIHPKDGWQYVNRHNMKPGMVEDIVPLMTAHGFFRWGGTWTTPIDFHHFEMPRKLGEVLIELTLDDGQRFLDMFAKNLTVPKVDSLATSAQLIESYKQDPVRFFEEFAVQINA